LKEATILGPSDAMAQEAYGRGLVEAGKLSEAVVAFKESVLLDPNQSGVRAELATVLERTGDWAGALEQYRQCVLAEGRIDRHDPTPRMISGSDPQKEYEAAQGRFKQHLAALKAAGKGAEATDLEARVEAASASPKISEQMDAALQAGDQANMARHFDEALRQYKEAVRFGEQLQPNQQFITALDHIGNLYMGQDWQAADEAFGRELKVSAQTYGAQSPNLAQPLQSLGTSALLQKKYNVALKYYSEAADLIQKTYGEGSEQFAESQRVLSRVFFMQKQYDKTEPYLLRAVKIDEGLMGPDSPRVLMPLAALCSLYDSWGQAEKLEACESRLTGVMEKQYGANSPALLSTLDYEAKVLRRLGRGDRAAEIEKRIDAIRTAAVNPD
jgi:tetratricopeptide (TPR) repeat protein